MTPPRAGMDAGGVRRRIANGLGAHGLQFFITALLPIVSVPIFLHMWGTRLYGEWLLLSAIPAYFAMSDIGFGTVAANEMTIKMSRDDSAGALEVFQSVWLFVSGISGIAAVLGISAAWGLPFEQWLNLSALSHGEAATVASLLLIHVLVGLQGGFNAAGFRCVGLYARGIHFGNGLRLAEQGGLLAAVVLGAGPVVAAMVYLLLRMTGTVLIRLALRRQVPWLAYGWKHARRQVVRRLSGAAVAFMGLPLGNALSMQGLLTLVGVLLNPAAVVVLSTVRTLVNVVRQLMAMLQGTVWPELSMAIGSGDMGLARRLHASTVQASVGIAAAAVSFLFVAGEWIISVWTRGAVTPDPLFFRMMLLVAIANTFWFASSVVPASVNRHHRLALSYVLSAAAALGLAALLIPWMGLAGVPTALLVIDVVMATYVLRNSLRILGEDSGAFTRRLFQHPFRRSAQLPTGTGS